MFLFDKVQDNCTIPELGEDNIEEEEGTEQRKTQNYWTA